MTHTVILAGILAIIGIVIYGVRTQHDARKLIYTEYFILHASFGFCMVAGCLAILAGIHYLLDERCHSQPQGVYPSAGYSVGATGTILSPPAYSTGSPPTYSTYPAGSYFRGTFGSTVSIPTALLALSLVICKKKHS